MAYYGTQTFNRRADARRRFRELAAAETPAYYDRLTVEQKARLAQAEAIADAVLGAASAIRRLGAWLVSPVKRWAAERAVRDELLALDERTLADIGLTRGDIPRVAAGLWVPENRSVRTNLVVPKAANNVNDTPQAAA